MLDYLDCGVISWDKFKSKKDAELESEMTWGKNKEAVIIARVPLGDNRYSYRYVRSLYVVEYTKSIEKALRITVRDAQCIMNILRKAKDKIDFCVVIDKEER